MLLRNPYLHLLFVATVLFQPSLMLAQENSAIKTVQKLAVENFIQPGYQRFDQQTNLLVSTTAMLCESPSNETLDSVRSVFLDTALAWGKVEFLRFGPALTRGRIERVLYYQGGKYSGVRQIRKVLKTRDASAIDVKRLGRKSIALQGLAAFEYLLFAAGSPELGASVRSDEAEFRCAYARAIAGNLAQIAEILNRRWQNSNLPAANWSGLGNTTGDVFDERDALNRLLATLVHGLEVVRDARVRSFIGKTSENDRANIALFYRSQNTFPMITSNIQAFQKLYDRAEFVSLVPDSKRKMANMISNDFKRVLTLIGNIDGPVQAALADPQDRQAIKDIDRLLTKLITVLDRQFAPAAGLAAGFAFTDGD